MRTALLTAIATALLFGSMAAGAALNPKGSAAVQATRDLGDYSAKLHLRDNLLEHCLDAGISCIGAASGIYFPEAKGIIGNQPATKGGTLYLIDNKGGSGIIACGRSRALWRFADSGGGEKVFDGSDQGGDHNYGISGVFTTNPRGGTTHGIARTNQPGADLVLNCGSNSSSSEDAFGALDDSSALLGRAQMDTRASSRSSLAGESTLDNGGEHNNLERRDNLAERCKSQGVSCMAVRDNVPVAEATGIEGSESAD